MKIIKSAAIATILRETWPSLRQIWIFDRALVCITQVEIEAIIKEVWEKMIASGEKLDCDERALFLHAAVKKYWASNYAGNETFAFGEVAGTIFNGWSDTHNQNVAVTESGRTILIEPQTKEIWTAHKTDDQPYWMRF